MDNAHQPRTIREVGLFTCLAILNIEGGLEHYPREKEGNISEAGTISSMRRGIEQDSYIVEGSLSQKAS